MDVPITLSFNTHKRSELEQKVDDLQVRIEQLEGKLTSVRKE